jgi:hypothetical protein
MDNPYPTNTLRSEGYIVEVDGKFESEYGTLTAALKAGLELRYKFPHIHVKVHDADEHTQTPAELAQ